MQTLGKICPLGAELWHPPTRVRTLCSPPFKTIFKSSTDHQDLTDHQDTNYLTGHQDTDYLTDHQDLTAHHINANIKPIVK